MCLSGFYFCSLMKDDSRVLSGCFSFSAVTALTLPPNPRPPLKLGSHCLFCASFSVVIASLQSGGNILFYFILFSRPWYT